MESFPFGFPVAPYDIQESLMQALNTALDTSSVAILESPTGTVNSLYLVCSCLSPSGEIALLDLWLSPLARQE
jgi:Rad3-related DNA helicase